MPRHVTDPRARMTRIVAGKLEAFLLPTKILVAMPIPVVTLNLLGKLRRQNQ